MNSKRQTVRYGFTIIELILSITIAAVILTPISIIILQSVVNTFLPEYYLTASSLLEGELERVTDLGFDSIGNEGPVGFTGNFSQYSYRVSVYYVDPDALNTPSASSPTDYKRVQITVSRSGFPDVSAVTIASNH